VRLPILVLFFVQIAATTAWNVLGFDRHTEAVQRYTAGVVALPRPEVVRTFSFGFRDFLSDLYWVGAVNYYGDARNMQMAYAELPNYLNIVSEAEPKFYSAYLFGGYAIPWNRGDKWVNTEEAADFLGKGIHEFPYDWKLKFQLAYIESAYLNRYQEAAEHLKEAAKIPGAPQYLGDLATRLYVTSGDSEGAKTVAEEIYRTSPDPAVRYAIKRRIAELQVLNDIKRLQEAVNTYRDKHGALPSSPGELVRDGEIDAIPKESLGGQFTLDPKTGEVNSTVLKDRLAIYIHPDKHDSPAKIPANPRNTTANDAGNP
jgi:tetratricopeptide (TPR) repeat protein